MPYDPNVPANNAEATSAMFRGQFQGLKELIDLLQSITAAQVDAVNTVPAGDPANVSVSVVGSTLHFTFDLPQGNDGAAGADGAPGNDGAEGPAGPPGIDGSDGAPGQPFADAIVDGVTTLGPGESATVDVNFDGTNVRFSFGIPQGNDGSPGSDGAAGEISQQQLDDAIFTTSANTNNVDTLDTAFTNDPPNVDDMELLRAKLNELILNGRK